MNIMANIHDTHSALHSVRGRFDIIGDVHGMGPSLLHLMRSAGWVISEHDRNGCSPITAYHPAGRHLVFTGDMINKGPHSLLVLRLLVGMVEAGNASAVMGNHEDMLLEAIYDPSEKPKKCVRKLRDDLASWPAPMRTRALALITGLPSQLSLPMPLGLALSGDGHLTVVHAGALPDDIGKRGSQARKRCVHGAALDMSVKKGWHRAFDKGQRWIVYGHTPSHAPIITRRTIGIDTDAALGGQLTMLRADDATFVAVSTAIKAPAKALCQLEAA